MEQTAFVDAEQSQLEHDANLIDSIALESLSSKPAPAAQPTAEPDAERTTLNPPQADPRGSIHESEHEALSARESGEQIDEYCDVHRLDVRARIELFIQACKAVHVAHQHAVIDGHLKPHRILITPDRVPRLVDFGQVSAAPEDELPTPEYTSPEQITGESVTTASDVYTLGVIFYRLMTGRRPYHFKTRNIQDALQAIFEQAPEKPSDAVLRSHDHRAVPFDQLPETTTTHVASPTEPPPSSLMIEEYPSAQELAAARRCSARRLSRVLQGDLNAIILTAMRKEPERRYASADHFARDLRLYLGGFPVTAQPDSVVYRSLKFIQRNRAAVLTGMLLIGVLLAGIMGVTRGLIIARHQRTRAQQSFFLALQSVNQLFMQVSQERLLDQPGLEPLRKKLLEVSERSYQDILAGRTDDHSIQAEVAQARTNLAVISSATGSTSKAMNDFELAVALWQNLVAAEPRNSAYHESLAHTLAKQGGLVVRLPGRGEEAGRIFHRASVLLEELVAESHTPAAEQELALVLQQVAELEHEQGQGKEAIKKIQRSLTIESKLAVKYPDRPDSLIPMAKGHALLGKILAARYDGVEQAIPEYQQAVDLLEIVNREHSEFSDQSYELGRCLGELSRLEQSIGNLDSALTSVRKAADYLERIEREHPAVIPYQHLLANTYTLAGEIHRFRREPEEGMAFAQKAKTRLEKLIALQPDRTAFRLDIARSHNLLGRLLQDTGEPIEALRSFQRAVDVYESLPTLDMDNCYSLACNLALSVPLIGTRNGSVDKVDSSKLSKADQIRRGRYSDRAIEVLRQASREGRLDLDVLRLDTDLDPIRDQPGFQALVDEVEKKSNGGSG